MIELVALDADDTLWQNEPRYTSTRELFRSMLKRYEPSGAIADTQDHEIANIRELPDVLQRIG